MTLNEIADLVEQAEGPDRELDARIGATCGVIDFEGRHGILGMPFFGVTDDGKRIQFCTRLDDGSEHIIATRLPREFTASLDAALTLTDETNRFHRVGKPLDGESIKPFVGAVTFLNEFQELEYAFGEAVTPALALTAAALRARSTIERDHGG